MAYVHIQVNATSRVYLQSERRYNYTTPKSFLEQISLYSKLLQMKSAELASKVDRLENGLEKLKNTAEQVCIVKLVLQAQLDLSKFTLRGFPVTIRPATDPQVFPSEIMAGFTCPGYQGYGRYWGQ